MRIYVGNLSYDTTDETLGQHFAQYGEVAEAAVVTDRETGQSRGFGFVTMPNAQQGQAAIEACNGVEFEGRKLVVNEAKPKPGGGRNRRAGI